MAKISTSPDIIMAVVAEKFQLLIADLKGNSSQREISFARQIGMYLMRQHTDLSLPAHWRRIWRQRSHHRYL
jgi:chromosomal replication initiator protein